MASEVVLDPYQVSTGSPLELNINGKKSWNELRKSARDTMKTLTVLGGSTPSSFTFRSPPGPSGSFLGRLYFLAIPEKGRDNTLLYVDVVDDEHSKFVLPWLPLLDTVHCSLQHLLSGQLSKEEQLMRERKRLGSYGITSYDYHEERGRFIFPANNSLYMVDDPDFSDTPQIPVLIETSCIGARLDPKICPVHPDIIGFINNNDIWVSCVTNFTEMQLTFTRSCPQSQNLADNPITAGTPSFVMSEEFDRYTGYWWQPTDTCLALDEPKTLRILFEEVDESEVEILHTFAPNAADSVGVEEYRYPRTGTTNARSVLKIVEFQVNDFGPVAGSRLHRHLVEPLTAYCPWAEYLVRAGWTPDGKYVYAQLLNRLQLRLCILLIPLACFVPISDSDSDMNSFDRAGYPQVQCIYEESSDIWINVHDILHFFPQSVENEISFVWASQKSGFRHLYHVTSVWSVLSTSSMSASSVLMDEDSVSESGCLKCQILHEAQLTSGKWDVLGKPVWVDEKCGVVYFQGLKDTPLETHLYAVSYIKPQEPIRLSDAGFSHTVALNSDCSLFVTTFSSIDTAPVSQVHKLEVSGDRGLSVTTCSTIQEPPVCTSHQHPELFSFESSCGYTLYGMYYQPHNQRPSVRYPTVLFVYGGPQVQLVTNSFKGLKFLRLHTLAAHGYGVVIIDGRGSVNRGLQFEGHIKNRLGIIEIDDQVEGLRWLAAHTDFIDLSRVAIHGWSYGGYLSLMGLAQRPDVFKIALAGAPVVSWRLYDTGYTERYMSLPLANPSGYEQGSVLHYLDNFPDEENRLLIVHGLIDENVHFHHTSQLVTALVKACKPHRLQVYPNERHGIRSHESNEHYKTLVLSFLQDNL